MYIRKQYLKGNLNENSTRYNCLTKSKTTAPVVVACAADNTYALPLGVMLASLSAHANPDRRIDVYIVDCGLSDSVRSRINKQIRSNLHFHWLPSTRSLDISDPYWGHVSSATYDRLLIDDYVPKDTVQALWLDCDLLVLDDITTLFNNQFTGSTLRAVHDPFIRCMGSSFGVRHWRELGLASDNPYFNAGVMLIDMTRWRATKVADRAIQHLRHYGKQLIFREQEALNAVIGQQWEPLADRWNYSANPFHAKKQNLNRGAPAIIHFAGRIKPWNLSDLGTSQDLYFQQVDKTSWRGTRPKKTARNKLLSWYACSRLRNLTYPLENQHLRLRHHLGI